MHTNLVFDTRLLIPLWSVSISRSTHHLHLFVPSSTHLSFFSALLFPRQSYNCFVLVQEPQFHLYIPETLIQSIHDSGALLSRSRRHRPEVLGRQTRGMKEPPLCPTYPLDRKVVIDGTIWKLEYIVHLSPITEKCKCRQSQWKVHLPDAQNFGHEPLVPALTHISFAPFKNVFRTSN